jgi:phage-related protein
METITVLVGDTEVPLVQLSYEDIERGIQDWLVAGVTDPLGQLVSWLRDQVEKIVSAVRDAILGALNSIASSITSAISGAINTIVGAISSGINSLVNTISSGLSGLLNTLSNILSSAFNTLSSALSSAMSTIVNALSSAISGLVNTISSVASTIGSALSTVVSTIASALSSVASAIMSAISGAINAIVGAVSGIASAISGAISSIISGISSVISSLAGAITSALSAIANAMSSALSAVANSITSALSSLASTLTGILNALVSTIMAGISGLVSQLSSLLSSIIDAITKTISSIIDAVSKAITDLGHAIVDSFTGAFSALTNTLMSIFSNIVAGLQQVAVTFQGFVNSIAGLGDVIAGPLKSLADAIMGFFKDPIGAISKALSDAWKAIVDITKPIWQPLQEFFANLWNFLQDLWNNFVKTLSDAWDAFVKLTEPIWKPILDFIDFVSKTVWEGINNFIKMITEGLSEFFKDPLGFIVRQITAAWSGFVEFTRPIWEPIQKFFEGVWKFLEEVWDNITKALSDAWNTLVDITKPVWEPIQKFFTDLWNGLQQFLKDPVGFIVNAISSMWSGFVEFTKPLWEPISQFFTNVGKFFDDLLKTLVDWATTIVKFIAEDIPRFFTQDLPKFLTEDLPDILFKIGKTILEGLSQLGEAIINAFKLLGEWILRALVALFDVGKAIMEGAMNKLIMPMVKTIQEAVKPASPPPEVKQLVETLNIYIVSSMQSFGEVAKNHDQVSEEMLTLTAGLSGTLGVLYATAQVGGLLADIIHPLKNIGTRKTLKSLIDSFGGFFIQSAPAASFTFFLLHPMLRRFWQKQARPVLPGPDTLTTMYFRETFDEKYYAIHMSELGYADTFIKGFIDINANIPTVQQLIRLVGAEKIDRKEALNQLKKAGWIGERGWLGPDVVFDGLKEPPSITNAFELYWKKMIDLKELKKIYMWQGRHEDYFELEVDNQYKMPPIADLVTFVIREIIEPEDFKTLVLMQGLQPKEVIKKILGKPLIMPLIGGGRGEGDWADAYWEAHWRLPAPEQIFEFYNRAVVGMVSVEGKPFQIDTNMAEKVVMAYTTIHDYKPDPRILTGFVKSRVGIDKIPVADEALVRSLRYRVLTRIESRFVRRWGLISTDDYMRLGIAQGIDPYIKIKTLDGNEIAMVEALTTAEFLQDLVEERTALRTQIINSFVRGFNIRLKILYVKDKPGETEEREIETLKLADSLKLLRFRPEEISWLAAQALIRREIEIREDKIKSLIDDYVAGILTPQDFEKELTPLIDDSDVRRSVIEFYTKKRMRERYRHMYARLERDLLRELDTQLRLYENGYGSKDEAVKLMDSLISNGIMTEDEKAMLLSISETRRKRELVELAIRALAKRVARAEITPEVFATEASKLGVDKDFIDKLLEVNVPFYTLSVASLISYADDVPLPEDLVDKKLKLLRVPEDEAKIIKAVIARRPISDEIRSLLSTLQSLADDLEVTPGEAGGVMEALGLTSLEIQLRKKIIERLNRFAIRRQIRRTLNVLLREQYEALTKGQDPKLITLDDYIKMNKALGMPDEYIISKAQEILANYKLLIPQWQTLKSVVETGKVVE